MKDWRDIFDQKFTPNSIYPEEVKQFIASLLSEQREEVLEETLKIITLSTVDAASPWSMGYNTAALQQAKLIRKARRKLAALRSESKEV